MEREMTNLTAALDEMNADDKKNRRSGIHRRRFSYTHHLPERRAGNGRRRDDDNKAASKDER